MAVESPLLDEFATKAQVAEMFGVAPRTIERWVRLRQIPAPSRIGKHRLWHLPTLHKHLARGSA